MRKLENDNNDFIGDSRALKLKNMQYKQHNCTVVIIAMN